MVKHLQERHTRWKAHNLIRVLYHFVWKISSTEFLSKKLVFPSKFHTLKSTMKKLLIYSHKEIIALLSLAKTKKKIWHWQVLQNLMLITWAKQWIICNYFVINKAEKEKIRESLHQIILMSTHLDPMLSSELTWKELMMTSTKHIHKSI